MNYCRAGIFLLSLLTIHSCGGGGGGVSSPSGAADTVSSSAFVNANGALAGVSGSKGTSTKHFGLIWRQVQPRKSVILKCLLIPTEPCM